MISLVGGYIIFWLWISNLELQIYVLHLIIRNFYLFTQDFGYKNGTDQYKTCHKQKNAPNWFEFSVFYCNTDSGSCLVVKGVYRWCYWCFQKNFHLLPSQKITKIKHQNHPEWNEIASNEIAIKTVFSTLMSQPLRICFRIIVF